MATKPREPDLLDPPAAGCDACGMVDCQCPAPPAEALRPGGLLVPAEAIMAALDSGLLGAIYGSPSVGAFIGKRVDQAVRQGHTPAADLDRNPFDIARAALDRVRDLRELLDGRAPPADRLARALVKCEAAGAMLMALHDRLRAALAAAADTSST